jgi:hypothetical protein
MKRFAVIYKLDKWDLMVGSFSTIEAAREWVKLMQHPHVKYMGILEIFPDTPDKIEHGTVPKLIQ